jgi:hypothetical protein
MMENIKESIMPESLWAEDPKFAQQCQDVYDYLKRTPFSKAFPNKYKAITKGEALEKTFELFEENPNMPLKSVVTTVLNGLDDDISAEMVVEMTRIIIKEWKELTTLAYADKPILELV